MKTFKKVIFAGKSGTCREPMAMALLQGEPLWKPIQVEAKGLVVLFPEPLNQKAEAVLASNGLRLPDFMSSELTSQDFAEDTLILTFNQQIKDKICGMEHAQNVYILTEVTGDELEIMDPYGRDILAYGICLETMTNSIKKLADILNESTFFV